ncbi:MAG: methyltransferase domain-containing protein [Labilithrix sp.]|nr:methyltransferase domain-containing protein [Labilithrix sp.]
MDLIETHDGPRHPWEKSRAAFFTGVLERALGRRGAFDALDCGAGDAFFSATMSATTSPRSVTCWDASYDDATVARLMDRYGGASSGTTFSFTRTMPSDRRFDLVLMLDVIEHVEDDVGFVTDIVESCVAPETGLVLVSVPAWQALFTRHDELLRHHRRYSPDRCDRVLRSAGLDVVARGGLFHSLLAPRFASALRERAEGLVGRSAPLTESAASTWTGGRLVTSVVDAALRADNAVSRAAARAGLNVPGLSYWTLARKRS